LGTGLNKFDNDITTAKGQDKPGSLAFKSGMN